jgi:hypothetical protein
VILDSAETRFGGSGQVARLAPYQAVLFDGA